MMPIKRSLIHQFNYHTLLIIRLCFYLALQSLFMPKLHLFDLLWICRGFFVQHFDFFMDLLWICRGFVAQLFDLLWTCCGFHGSGCDMT